MDKLTDDMRCPRCGHATIEPGQECASCRADAIQRETEAAIRLYDQFARLQNSTDVWWFK